MARALANDPPLLPADEPSGGLDTASVDRIVEFIRRLRQNGNDLTVVMVTHDLRVAAAADRIVRMRGGRVEDAGRTDPMNLRRSPDPQRDAHRMRVAPGVFADRVDARAGQDFGLYATSHTDGGIGLPEAVQSAHRNEECAMAGLAKREGRHVAARDVLDPLERMFEDWQRTVSLRWPGVFPQDWVPDQLIRVDEFREGNTTVVRAELPGIDPEKDVEVSVSDGTLRIEAERHEEENVEEKGYVRRELRSGSFLRTLPLPPGVKESDISAKYTDGILEIRIPSSEPQAGTKIPIAKA